MEWGIKVADRVDPLRERELEEVVATKIRFQIVHLFARLSTVALRLPTLSSILLPLHIRLLQNLGSIAICRTESSCGTAIRMGAGIHIRTLGAGGGRKEPGKEEDEMEPQREREIEMNPLVWGGRNGGPGLRGKSGRRRRGG
jgi:hypothetical protein